MTRFRPILAVLIGSLTLGGALAQVPEVCLDDRAGLNAPAMGSFYQEFQQLAGAHGVKIEGGACEPGKIRILLTKGESNHPSDVLGAAPVVTARVEPRFEIYVDRVVALLPETQCWNAVGRALARVAAHEVAHFIDQDLTHSRSGLLQAHFSGAQLAGEDSYPFRWISSRQKRSGE
jgi:hypothetical protein